jgi:hypothetical protein
MRRIFCWLGLHHWEPASANVLDPRTIACVYICEHCGKEAEGKERRNRERKNAKARVVLEVTVLSHRDVTEVDSDLFDLIKNN